MAEREKPQPRTEEELRIALQALTAQRNIVARSGSIESDMMRDSRRRDAIRKFGIGQVMLGIRYALGEAAEDKVDGIFDIPTLVDAYRSSQRLRRVRETLVSGRPIAEQDDSNYGKCLKFNSGKFLDKFRVDRLEKEGK